MFVIHRCLGAALLAASLGAQAQDNSITVDGQSADWAGVPVTAAALGQSAQSIKAVVRGDYLYVLVQGENLPPNYNLFINTDADATTGYQSLDIWTGSSGADFLLSGGSLWRSTSTGWTWSQVDVQATDASGGVIVSANATTIEARIPLVALGLTATTASNVTFAVQTVSAGWVTDSALPKASTFVKYGTTVPNGPAFAVGKGFIIPAYLTLNNDATNWNLLKEAAAQFKTANNPTYTDFWVAVNGPNSGPIQNTDDWTTAKRLWDPIRENGGRIFGYIHTLQSPDSNQYRSLAEVEKEVTAWVNGYPGLDGIWIDEFYPRYEIAATDGEESPSYPNGTALAPSDKGFLDPATGKFRWAQIHPAGGYYEQLTSWIRKTYPQLRLIGNAGGDLYSNQYEYGNLVDVLVSFEQNYDTARTYNKGDPWYGLERLNKITTAPGQLALIHGNTTDLAGAIDQALDHGYTHVYTTNRIYGPNVWGGVPSYLMSEIQYVTSKR